MICPECGGQREVTRRLLWFFTVRRPCPRCTPGGRDDRWTDDSSRRTEDSLPLSAVSLLDRERDQFEVGSAGRSGGAGGGSTWTDDAPVIVDPFSADGSVPAERDPESDFSGTDSESASSDDSASGSDGGTTY
jgi:hypothetical protein